MNELHSDLVRYRIFLYLSIGITFLGFLILNQIIFFLRIERKFVYISLYFILLTFRFIRLHFLYKKYLFSGKDPRVSRFTVENIVIPEILVYLCWIIFFCFYVLKFQGVYTEAIYKVVCFTINFIFIYLLPYYIIEIIYNFNKIFKNNIKPLKNKFNGTLHSSILFFSAVGTFSSILLHVIVTMVDLLI
jgi:hypothetical protein